MSSSPTRPGGRLRLRHLPSALLLLPLLLLPACSEDPPTGPHIDQVIQVRDITIIPSTVTLQVGQWVEWQNRSRELRTVTSGLGADDPAAGDLFDQELPGYSSGEAIGGRFQRQFTEPDTIYYFSREVPDGYTGQISGVIFVEP